MLKYILGVVVFLVAVTAAFYAGLFVGRAKREPPPGTPPAPPADTWTYPGAPEMSRIGSKTGSFLVNFTTPDDFDTVARFYDRQIGEAQGLKSGIDPATAGTSSLSFGWGTYRYVADSAPSGAEGARKVRVLAFEVRSVTYDLSVFVSRAEGEKDTHVLLSFDPKEQPH